jgi:HNH endonuclease
MEKLRLLLPQLARLHKKLDESYAALQELSYDELSDDRKRAYQSYKISYLVIPLNTPKADVFEVYEDINSGGEYLTAQQVRRAVYYGPYINVIDDLKETCADFHAVRDPRAVKVGTYAPCKKDSDGELILRAFAFRHNGNRFKTPIKSFLNRELDGSADVDCTTEEHKRRVAVLVEQRRHEFVSVMKIARQIFGDIAFRKGKEKEDNDIEQSTTKKNTVKKETSDYAISTTMWDAQYCAIAELMAHHPRYVELDFVKSKDRIAAALQDNIRYGFFATDDNKTTASKFELRKHELKTLIQKAMETNGPRGERSHHGVTVTTTATTTLDQRRSFPPEWRRRLFVEQNGQCGLCGQSMAESRLDETGYVHMDHKQPYSMGGPTIYTNAQLVHSICNRSKSNKDVHG